MRMQVVQSRTGAAPSEPARYQVLPEAGISSLQVVVVEPAKTRRTRTKRAPQIVEPAIELRDAPANPAAQPAYLEIIRSS